MCFFAHSFAQIGQLRVWSEDSLRLFCLSAALFSSAEIRSLYA